MANTHCAPAATSHWALDPSVTFLNHGSFGATPLEVLEVQQSFRDRIERQPVQFYARDFEGLLDEARSGLAEFVGARADDLAFLTNATSGVNAVLRSLTFAPGDEILLTNHEYNACANAAKFVADHWGAQVVVAEVPFPIASMDHVFEAVMQRVTPRTKLALLDHITSPTGIIFPIERLVRELQSRGVDVLVDGAHAPGVTPLHLDALDAAYYTGNLHKWVCAPKGAAFLHVRRDRQQLINPLTISHGLNSTRDDRSRFRLMFDWMGTCDPSPWLSVPAAIEAVGAMAPGGWPEVMRRNHALAIAGRDAVLRALRLQAPAPDDMIGSMASIVLPAGPEHAAPSALYADPLQEKLLARWNIEVPVPPWPAPPQRLLRVSAQLYNGLEEYERLGAAVAELIAEESR